MFIAFKIFKLTKYIIITKLLFNYTTPNVIMRNLIINQYQIVLHYIQIICKFGFFHPISVFDFLLYLPTSYTWIWTFSCTNNYRQINLRVIYWKSIFKYKLDNKTSFYFHAICHLSYRFVLIPKLKISQTTIPKDHTSLLVVASLMVVRHSGAVHFRGIRS